MKAVCSVSEMRNMDCHMINAVGIPGGVLMENAAAALADAVCKVATELTNARTVILCGCGNNGGDGIALLRKLSQGSCCNKTKACAVIIGDSAKMAGDALVNYNIALNAGLDITNDIKRVEEADVIVDAIFGTGLSKPVEGIAKQAILLANSCNAKRIAADIPSGLNGDTGEVMGCVFNADITVTFQAVKRGLILTKNREAVGEIVVAPIGLMKAEEGERMKREQLLDETEVRRLLPQRSKTANKGSFGRSLIVAGACGMAGAAVMSTSAVIATNAAVRAGAGLTKALIPRAIEGAFAATPEAMLVYDDDDDSVREAANWATAIGIGCGMGVSERTERLVQTMLKTGKPIVVDADALNTISKNKCLRSLLHSNSVITPHPAEMARLLDCQVSDVMDNPVDAATGFANIYGCNVLLKSATSIIAAPSGLIRYNTSGSNALAKGGSGDVLTGIITGLLAGGAAVFNAACAGAYLLGCSAVAAFDILRERMVTAVDVTEALTAVINKHN